MTPTHPSRQRSPEGAHQPGPTPDIRATRPRLRQDNTINFLNRVIDVAGHEAAGTSVQLYMNEATSVTCVRQAK